MANKKDNPPENLETILAIDAGTQSIRAALIDVKGQVHKIVKTPIEPYFSTHPGWAEQDPKLYWDTLAKTTKSLMREGKKWQQSIKGVTLTTQRNTMINLDAQGNVLRPAIVWMDMRKAELEQWPPPMLRWGLKAINMLDALEHTIRDSEANWIRQNQPEIWDKTDKFLFLSGFFTWRLTGEYRDSTANIVGYVPFDYKKQTWSKANDMKWQMFPMERSILPHLVQPGEILGHITEEAAKVTGIPKDLPVVAAGADKACEVLGSGCLSPEIACLSFGTTATVETTNAKYVEVTPFFPSYPSAVPGMFNTEVMIYRGFWMVSWFKKEFGLREMMKAEERGVAPEVLFDELIESIPPGSMGLMLQPYWSPGVKVPGPEAKGSIIGFGDVHTRAHIYRAMLEGLAFALKEGAQRTAKRNGVAMDRVRVSGGGSQSKVAMQLTADIFDLPVEKPHTYETSALGAAVDAAVGLGLHRDFNSAVAEMTGVGEIYEPQAANRDLYRELYERVYLNIYKRLQPLYSEIQDITGYPPKN